MNKNVYLHNVCLHIIKTEMTNFVWWYE